MNVDQKAIKVRDLADGYSDDGEGGVFGYGGKLDIRPPYQREFVYKDDKRDEVIRTAAKGFPLNTMYWAVRKGGGFEVIDGQQRSISLCQFVKNHFSVKGLFGVDEPQIFDNLKPAEQEAILEYPLTVYQCIGGDRERLDWFRIVNIAGEKLLAQELLNANYSGPWLADAKGWFSRANCQAHHLYGRYLSGSAIRQEYLETALKWISEGDIAEYMAKHQNDADAAELWGYVQSVFRWVQSVFPQYNAAMKGIAWGDLHRAHKNGNWESAGLQERVDELMADDEVQKKKGIYEYVLSGEEKHLNLRAFSNADKRTAFARQKEKCAKCGKLFSFEEMEGDHITPWSKSGKTTGDNCQMLCKECNRRKSDR